MKPASTFLTAFIAVTAFGRVSYSDPTMEIGFDSTRMLLVDNSGALEDLEGKVKTLSWVLR